MKILLMGGTGAMGTPLAKILANNGHEVYVTSRTDHSKDDTEFTHYLRLDAHDINFVQSLSVKFHYDAIIDFLKYTPEQFYDRVNLLLSGTEQYFLLSSCRVYADNGPVIDENSKRLLESNINEAEFATEMYALTKAREEDILTACDQTNWTIIRPYLTYNDYRLQLGFYEKEQWLYRTLLGKTLLFPTELLDKRTTLTHGRDVANIIALLIGKNNALKTVFNLTSDENYTWQEILRMYAESVYKHTRLHLNVRYIDDITKFYKFWPFSLINYDRCYNRVFDNNKLLSVVDKYDFVPLQEGLDSCIRNFIKNPIWQGYSTRYEALSDRLLGEFTPINKIPGKRAKIRYLMDRFL